jgi:hypothetical protein
MKKRSELNIGILYISLYNQLKNNTNMSRIISRERFFTIIGKHYLVPKPLRDLVIKEMEQRQLIKCCSKETIEILDCDYNLNEPNKFYQRIGLY